MSASCLRSQRARSSVSCNVLLSRGSSSATTQKRSFPRVRANLLARTCYFTAFQPCINGAAANLSSVILGESSLDPTTMQAVAPVGRMCILLHALQSTFYSTFLLRSACHFLASAAHSLRSQVILLDHVVLLDHGLEAESELGKASWTGTCAKCGRSLTPWPSSLRSPARSSSASASTFTAGALRPRTGRDGGLDGAASLGTALVLAIRPRFIGPPILPGALRTLSFQRRVVAGNPHHSKSHPSKNIMSTVLPNTPFQKSNEQMLGREPFLKGYPRQNKGAHHEHRQKSQPQNALEGTLKDPVPEKRAAKRHRKCIWKEPPSS